MVVANMRTKQLAFTMIELIVVLAMIATLISIVMPNYFDGLTRAKETALKQNLNEMRAAIGHYYDDKGHYPVSLETLVNEGYIRFIPVDPITERTDTWVVLEQQEAGVADVQSGAEGVAKNGQLYNSW